MDRITNQLTGVQLTGRPAGATNTAPPLEPLNY